MLTYPSESTFNKHAVAKDQRNKDCKLAYYYLFAKLNKPTGFMLKFVQKLTDIRWLKVVR